MRNVPAGTTRLKAEMQDRIDQVWADRLTLNRDVALVTGCKVLVDQR